MVDLVSSSGFATLASSRRSRRRRRSQVAAPSSIIRKKNLDFKKSDRDYEDDGVTHLRQRSVHLNSEQVSLKSTQTLNNLNVKYE